MSRLCVDCRYMKQPGFFSLESSPICTHPKALDRDDSKQFVYGTKPKQKSCSLMRVSTISGCGQAGILWEKR